VETTKKKRRTKAEIQAQRREDWQRLAHNHYAGFYVCGHCGQSKHCRGRTRKRVACEECFMAKGAPRIGRKS